MTNETIASQLAHRTIRAYKDQPLTEEEVTTLMDVAPHGHLLVPAVLHDPAHHRPDGT